MPVLKECAVYRDAMDWSEVGRFALKCTRQHLQYHLVRAQSPPENPKGEALWSGQLPVSICVPRHCVALCGSRYQTWGTLQRRRVPLGLHNHRRTKRQCKLLLLVLLLKEQRYWSIDSLNPLHIVSEFVFDQMEPFLSAPTAINNANQKWCYCSRIIIFVLKSY